MSQKKPTTIPAKQLQISGTFSELAAKLLDREVGWCTDDLQLYCKHDGELVPTSYGEFAKFSRFNIAEEYNPDNVYKKNSFVTREGKIFVAVDSNVTGSWDASKWEQMPLGDYISKISSDMASNNDFVYIDPWNGDDANIGITPDVPVKTLAGAWAASQEKYPYRTDQLNITLVSDGESAGTVGLDVSTIPDVARLIIHGDVPDKDLYIYGENTDLSIYSDANISYFKAYGIDEAFGQGLYVNELVVSNVDHFEASDSSSELYVTNLIVHVNKYGFTSEGYISVSNFYCDAVYVDISGSADIGNNTIINTSTYVNMGVSNFNCSYGVTITSGGYVALNTEGKFNASGGLTIRSSGYVYMSASELTSSRIGIDALSYVTLDCATISGSGYSDGIVIKSGTYVNVGRSGGPITVRSLHIDALEDIYISGNVSTDNNVVLNCGDDVSTQDIDCYTLTVSTGSTYFGNISCTECYVDAKENISASGNTIISSSSAVVMTSGSDIMLSVVESGEVYLSCEDYLSLNEIRPAKYSGTNVSVTAADMSVRIVTHPETNRKFFDTVLTAKDYLSASSIVSENVVINARNAYMGSDSTCKCNYLYANISADFSFGGSTDIAYSTNINCGSYSANNGSHNYGRYFYLHCARGGYMGYPHYFDEGVIINDSGNLQGAPYIYADTLYVKSYKAELYGIAPRTATNANVCTFDIEDSVRFSQANISFGRGTVNIKARDIELNDAPSYCQHLNIDCARLVLNNSMYVGGFSINVTDVLTQKTPGARIYLPLRYTYGTGDSDYISYDNLSHNYLKAGALYCPTQYSDVGCGLLNPHYGNASRGIDIQIGMLLFPGYTSGGPMCPMVLGKCLSGTSTFNSTISGHVGGYVAYDGTNSSYKVSEWGHDVLYIDSSFGGVIKNPVPGSSDNKTGKITLKYDDVIETNHFWYDPNQGDDAFDGFTRQTPVKTATALLHAIMKKAGGSYNSDTRTFTVTDPITIHVLSTGVGSCRTATYAYGFSDVNNIFQTIGSEGIDFRLSTNSHVQFSMLEFVPEAPDMSLYVAGFGASVLIAKGFYCIGFIGYESSGISYLESSGSIIINNNVAGHNSNHNYYRSAVGPIYMQSRNIGLAGIFNCLTAKASGEIYVKDTYGGHPSTQDNCCLRGTTNIEAYDVYLGHAALSGSSPNAIGICGFASIKSIRDTTCNIDTIMGSVYFEGKRISGITASGYFRGDYHAKCNTYQMDSDGASSFSTYDAGGAGGAGLIDIEATSTIYLDGMSAVYAANLFLKAPSIYKNSGRIDLYGNNGRGKAYIECGEGHFSIGSYYYDTVSIKASRWYGTVIALSGGPWSASGSTYRMSWYIDVDEMQDTLYMPISGDNVALDVVGRIGAWNTINPVVWGDDPDLDVLPDLDGTSYYFSITAGSNSQRDEAIPCLIPEDSGAIRFLDDTKDLVAGPGINLTDTGKEIVLSASNATTLSAITPVLDGTLAVATLVPRTYNVISIPSEAVDLRIEVPVETDAKVLTEMAFEFTLSDMPLRSVEFKGVGAEGVTFATIIPPFDAGKVYQGTVVNRCITIISFT